MKVRVFPSDKHGCGSYRMIWPAEACAAQGYDVKVLDRFPPLLWNGNKLVGLSGELDADVVVFQRPARMQYLRVFEYLQAQGIKVVVDMDDLLSAIHPANPAFIPYQQVNDMHWMYADAACKLADLVTVTTPVLAESYGGHGRVAVLPNQVPESYLTAKAHRDDLDIIVVGWAGLTSTHPRDLQITHGAVNEALAKQDGAKFLALGDQKALDALGVRQRHPHDWQAGVPLGDWPRFISQLDIGLVPLDDTLFNRAKSRLKYLEYMSVGVVPVGSPTPDNIRIQEESGVGFIASTPNEWRDIIRELIEDREKLKEMSDLARKASAQYTIEGNAEHWWRAWTK